MRSARRPPSSIERFLVMVLVGFITLDLLLIVPAYASELRLDRLHPSLPIVNLRPLAAGRARITDGLGEEFAAPVRAVAGELERVGSTAFNIIRSEPDSAPVNPSSFSETPTDPDGQNNSGGEIAMSPSPTRTRAPATDPELTLEPTIEQPTLDPSLTLSPSPTLTPTTIHIASPTPTLQLSQASTIAPTATQSPAPTETEKPAATPTQVPSNTPAPTSPPPTSPPISDGYYYVALNGNDDNPGTESQPFRTIEKGVSVLGPGDTLYVKSGTYAESLDSFPSGTSWANPVTLAAYPGDIVTIKPNSGSEVLRFMRCHYIIVDGFVLDGANIEDNVLKITSEAHHIRIQNSEIRGAPGQGVLVTTDGTVRSDFNEFINLDVHDNGTTDFDHGLYIETSNNLIDRSSIHHNAGWGIHIYSSGCSDCANNNIVRNNAIYDNAAAGDREPGILLSSGSGSLAYNNLIWGNFKGIQVDHGVSDAKVYNNVVYANDDYGIQVTGKSVDAVIRNNIVYQNGGIEISDGGIGTIKDHNLVDIDPQFVDALGHDFHLLPSSPAIDAGIALSEVPNDHDGVARPQGAAFDIGAFEAD